MESGARLGPYTIDRELGAGGMGKVFAATVVERAPGLTVGDRVALKVVHPHLLEAQGFFMRFLREAQLGSSIQHENVVRTHHCDQVIQAGRPHAYLVMEYVEGQDLRGLLEELERVPEELCRHIGREIAKGLSAIHAKGVVHRDLKPENVLITPDHVVKVMDLGVAQLSEQALRLSQTGAFVGSVEYAAPEQFKGGEVDGRTDLHALGVLLYELTAGLHPYRGGGFHEAMQRVCESEPRRLGEVNPQLSAFFEEVVHTLLVKDPRGRFASATQLLAVLEEGEDSAWWHDRARELQLATKRPLRRIRIPRETAVYGRDKELERLRGLYAKAKQGDGQVVLIEGEAGIGKSRLVDELVSRLHAEGEDLNFLFGGYPPGGAAAVAGAFSTAFREQLGEGGSAAHLRETPLLVPAFDALLRGDAPPAGAERLTTASIATCFVQAARALAAERATVLLIDDLHFAPREARGLFAALAAAVPGHRLLLIGTMRPPADVDWHAELQRLEHVSLLGIERLFPKDLAALLCDSFKSEVLAERLAFQIATKSDGNPFFAFEIIRGLREGQFITCDGDGTWRSTKVIDEIEIPSSVLDLVNARVASLTDDERALVDVAACCGYEFDPGLVGQVLGLARIPTLRAFGQIERAHRLVRASGRSMVFDHHQVREALYGTLLEQLREEYHAELAVVLEARAGAGGRDPAELEGALCVELCEHFLRGGRGAQARRYLGAADAHLRASHRPDQRLRLVERVLAVPGLLAGAERARWLLGIADVGGPLELFARSADQEDSLREALRLAEDADDRELIMRSEAAVGWCLSEQLRAAESEPSFRRAIRLAQELGDRQREFAFAGNLAVALHRMGRYEEADALQRHVLAVSREIGDTSGETKTLLNLGRSLVFRGRPQEARPLCERALELAVEAGSRRDQAVACGHLGVIAREAGRFQDALELQERSASLSREVGDRSGAAAALLNRGTILSALGRPEEAVEALTPAVQMARELGVRSYLISGIGNLALALKDSGDLRRARQLLEEQIEMAREAGVPVSEAVGLVNLGPFWHELGDLAKARAALERSLEICRENRIGYADAYALEGLGDLAIEAGRLDEALDLHTQALELRTRAGHLDGTPSSLNRIASIRLLRGEHEAARSVLEQAIAIAGEQRQALKQAFARALRGCTPGGDLEDAAARAAELGPGTHALTAYLHIYRASGDREHLVAAKRVLDATLETIPEEHRAAASAHRCVLREILEAWHREFGDGHDRSPDTESATRVG